MKFFSFYKFTLLISLGLHAAILWNYNPIIGSKSFQDSNDTILISIAPMSATATAVEPTAEFPEEKPISETELQSKTVKNLSTFSSNLSQSPSLVETIKMTSMTTNSHLDNKEIALKPKKSNKVQPLKLPSELTNQKEQQPKQINYSVNTGLTTQSIVKNSSNGDTSQNSSSMDVSQSNSFEPARFKNLVQPMYPYPERLRGKFGSVDFEIHISKHGKITDIQTKKTSGSKMLDRISKQAVLKSKVQPAKKNGDAIASIKTLRFTYKLN